MTASTTRSRLARIPRHTPTAALVLCISIPAAACGGDEPRAVSHTEVRDSAGITIVESAAPAWEEGEGWRVGNAPLIDLAESGEGLAHEFFQARDATRLSDGSFVVSDDGADEIRAENASYLPEDLSTASAVVREVMDLQPERTHRPAYRDMVVDARGHVWLRKHLGLHEADEPTEWLIFDPTGQWLGSVRLPPRFHIFRIGPDWILGKRPDELDVEHIQLLSLTRGGTAL